MKAAYARQGALWSHWAPTGVLVVAAVLLSTVQRQHEPQLRAPLGEALPEEVRGMAGRDASVSEAEALVAGFTDYALRIYGTPGDGTTEAVTATRWASVYLGFYSRQTRGKTIHSPKNCLPGAGWEPLYSGPQELDVAGDTVTVNRYVLQNGDEQALVLYWYQGRGRVAHNEYLVKWDLFRDAALMRRTDEALVRVVVPITNSEEAALDLAREIAEGLVGGVGGVLPE